MQNEPLDSTIATLGDQIRNMHTDLGPGLTALAAKAGVDLSDPCVMCKAADALDAARTLIVCLEERIDATEALKTGDLHLAYRNLREKLYG